MVIQALMLIDIFSTFDPANSSLFSLSPLSFWLISFIPLLLLTTSFWISPSLHSWNSVSFLSTIFSQTTRTNISHLRPLIFIIPSIFLIIIIINLLGLTPYIFRSSSHLILTLSLGVPLWLSLILSAIIFIPKSTIANLLPRGAPTWLNPALVLIETIRIFIRPITLCFRLAANITAGHIVLSLIRVYSSSLFFLSSSSRSLLTVVTLGYTLFEVGICLIQAYIFSLLLTLYSDDHPLT